ncbi:5'/3'-nucleotidase SurE [Mangrovicoccus ximenensis]|uniref:5'/3'-nucleotidase SurE n=1 Tax=Mangrovicoccus ximenensis TaxID=1911570 RepID=UPI000D3A41FC|nr:5'/3'-nucleotidase SurE [Mangrovicoccus ximenensis]
MSVEPVETLSFGTGAAFTLQLFHVSDQEANANSVDVIPNFSAVLNALRAEDIDGDGIGGHGETLFLSSGDAWIPGLFYDASEELYGQGGAADLMIQNLLGVQAIAFGNHEFDKGNGAIANILQGLAEDGSAAFDASAFPYLSGNIDFSADPSLGGLVTADGQAAEDIAGRIAGSTVVSTENGTRIGVVAATTPTIPVISSPSAETAVSPAQFSGNPTAADLDALAAVIQEDVDALLAANPDLDKVILMAHMQDIRIEEALATRLSDVDIIISGGSNTRLFDGNDAGYEGDAAQGGYPYFTTDADGLPVAVVNTDYQYKYVGRLVIDFDDNGVIIPESYDAEVSGAWATDAAGVAALGAEGMADPEIVAIAEAVRDVIVAGESEWYGAASVFLNGNRTGGGTDGVRTQETNLGNLTADANLAYAKGYDASVLVSIKNGGGIRDSIGQTVVLGGSNGEAARLPNEAVPGAKPEGGISSNDIGNVLAFNNGLSLVSLTTAELAAVLEHAVSNEPFSQEAGAGSFGQFGGLRFSFDPDAAPGSRVQNAVIVDDAGAVLHEIVRDGGIVDNGGMSFRAVTLDYLAGGGDGYPMGALSNPDLVNLYDLEASAAHDVVDGFAAGYEQDALAEYLLAEYGTGEDRKTFDQADTVVEEDTRIQNLDYRATDTSFHDTSAKDSLTILLTNDDGYSAEGLAAMHEALAEAGHTVYVVAPKGQNSGGGSTLGGTDALLSGIEVMEYADGQWWVDGTPTAAVMAALDGILAGEQVDLVISGTNEGENIGAFSNISGTVGAAVEAISRGIPAIAVSAGSGVDGSFDGAYARAGSYVAELIGQLKAAQTGETLLPQGTGLTVNVPSADPEGVAYTEITGEAPYMLGVAEHAEGNPATYGLAATPGTVTGAEDSEVSRFLDNVLTVSAMDGNWSADAGTREALAARIDFATTGAAAAPLKIVLTNDDGVGSDGTAALYDALVAAGHEVAIVAPMAPQEGAGTGLTLSGFMVTEYSQGWFADAAPSTVVGTALGALMTGEYAPDLVVAGINDGLLAGSDLRYSGTAGAIQAAVMGFGTGVISVAAERAGDHAFAAEAVLELIADLQATAGEGALLEGGLSVNIPAGASFASDVVFSVNDQASATRLAVGEIADGSYGFVREAGLSSSDALSEGAALARGAIAITALDANYGADDATAAAIGDLLGMALGELAALPAGEEPLVAEAADGTKLLLDAGTGAVRDELGHANATVIGLGDFDGDGRTDLLLRHDDFGWMKTLAAAGEGAIIGNAANAFVLALDADGDGADELLMQRGTGNYFLAEADGSQIGGLLRAGHDMFGAADMNGDGVEDILTERPDGTLAWLDLETGEGHGFGRGAGTTALAVADADGDGLAELIVETGIGRTVALDAEGAKVADYGMPGKLLAAGDLVFGGADELVFETATGVAVQDGATGALLAEIEGALAGIHRGGEGHADALIFGTGEGHARYDMQSGAMAPLEAGGFDLILQDPAGFGGLAWQDQIA